MSCENHKKEIAGITDMKVLAEMIENLHYESQADFLNHYCALTKERSINDRKEWKPRLANFLDAASNNLGFAAEQIKGAWQISKPFMKP